MPRTSSPDRPHPDLPTFAQSLANTWDGRWGFASGAAGGRTWWVGRYVDGRIETADDAKGRLRRFATARAAADAADALNETELASICADLDALIHAQVAA